MTPLGLGNDLGGSLRYPSQCTGIAAMRPTLGRVPRAGTIEPVDAPISIQLYNSEGPMARHVADLRLALEEMIKPSWRDPWHVPLPLAGPPLARPIRVALVVDPAGQGTAGQVARGVRKAADLLSASGYAVDEVEAPEVALAAETWANLIVADLHVMWPMLSPLVLDDANRFMSSVFEIGNDLDRGAHLQSFMARQSLARAWAEFQVTYPLILAPAGSTQPGPFNARAWLLCLKDGEVTPSGGILNYVCGWQTPRRVAQGRQRGACGGEPRHGRWGSRRMPVGDGGRSRDVGAHPVPRLVGDATGARG